MNAKKISLVLLFLSLLTVCVKTQEEEDRVTTTANGDDPVAERSDSENNDDSYISDEELDDEGYKVEDKQQEVLNSTIIEKSKKKENLPEAQVILPIRRRGTSQAQMGKGPCGGIEKKKSDTLTNRGSSVHVIWETINPVAQGNCTVKLSPGLDTEANFTSLNPIDIKLDKNGQFPCGRVKGFDSHEFKLPEDYVCDQCTLQWTWLTPAGNFYSCSDIIINGNNIEGCLAMCKNGGACFNGKCICAEGFYGDYCQHNGKFYNHLILTLY